MNTVDKLLSRFDPEPTTSRADSIRAEARLEQIVALDPRTVRQSVSVPRRPISPRRAWWLALPAAAALVVGVVVAYDAGGAAGNFGPAGEPMAAGDAGTDPSPISDVTTTSGGLRAASGPGTNAGLTDVVIAGGVAINPNQAVADGGRLAELHGVVTRASSDPGGCLTVDGMLLVFPSDSVLAARIKPGVEVRLAGGLSERPDPNVVLPPGCVWSGPAFNVNEQASEIVPPSR